MKHEFEWCLLSRTLDAPTSITDDSGRQHDKVFVEVRFGDDPVSTMSSGLAGSKTTKAQAYAGALVGWAVVGRWPSLGSCPYYHSGDLVLDQPR